MPAGWEVRLRVTADPLAAVTMAQENAFVNYPVTLPGQIFTAGIEADFGRAGVAGIFMIKRY